MWLCEITEGEETTNSAQITSRITFRVRAILGGHGDEEEPAKEATKGELLKEKENGESKAKWKNVAGVW